MSILLDAVTRNKQQQTSPLPDAVFTPRVNYPAPRESRIPVAKLSLLALAMSVGVGAAWGLSVWQPQIQSTLSVQTENATVKGQALTNSQALMEQFVSGQSSPVQQEQRLELGSAGSSTDTSGIRLAGKVALPRAQVFSEPNRIDSIPVGNATAQTMQMAPSGRNDPSYDDYLETSSALDESLNQNANDDIAYPNNIAETRDDPYGETLPSEPQEIALGANAERYNQAQLEALRLQVSAAAADVGLDKVPPRRNEQQLAETFQEALKEVEYVKSATTPVTEPKLDPIPKPQGDNIPKYGQLPAAVQLQVPEFNIVAHVYSTNARQRWLNVDGAELQEGDKIRGKLTIVSIRPRDVVLEIEGTQFKVPAI
ncbi:general secretion pathway protein GspB [Shewanella acanthi]|uniref:general secretion pathway protein GspB n=1 Tax=Shewanella acanthi TaxID=2864212 RepID=UPI001C658572|nr:general secretion pathway protein GspB [Shewanella acanthi]QYJ78020.1 general secretion pathway protein GspB [Shewanella acanthi]